MPVRTAMSLDPVRLDCCAHGLFLVFRDVDAEKRGVTYIPIRLEEVIVLEKRDTERLRD